MPVRIQACARILRVSAFSGQKHWCAMDGLSWGGLLTDTYSIFWKMIIRPPRASYSVAALGYAKFRLANRVFVRRDFRLVNDRNMKLECSHYTPADQGSQTLPCCVYLHGNCSSRLEAGEAIKVLLPRGVTVLTMDLSGSGLSEGEYISLGYWEEQDVRIAIEHLRSKSNVGAIGLWGRSMGAATSVLRASEDPAIAACVLDSPFSSLRLVAEELVNSGFVTVPQILLNVAMSRVRAEVQERAGFDLEELMPIRRAPFARMPVLFGVAKDDTFVLPHHTEELYNVWGAADRQLMFFEGGHNGVRPQSFMERASKFLAEKLGAPGDHDVLVLDLPRPVRCSPEGRPSATGWGRFAKRAEPTASEMPIAVTLTRMGFPSHMVEAAVQRHNTVQTAVDWIVRESQDGPATFQLGVAETPSPISGHRTPVPSRRAEPGPPTVQPGGQVLASPVRQAAPAAAAVPTPAQAPPVQVPEVPVAAAKAPRKVPRRATLPAVPGGLPHSPEKRRKSLGIIQHLLGFGFASKQGNKTLPLPVSAKRGVGQSQRGAKTE